MQSNRHPGRPALRALAIACAGALCAISAHAQDTASAQKVEKIEVTGSSIKRIDGEAALPVTVISRQDIDRSGVTTTTELLDRLSSNNGGGYAQSLAIGDSARRGFAGASLRGLGPNNTLILLNGRRIAVYAFDGGGVNLNNIPLAALDRVEVLRDGASAVYGTDAIGGVINFITRKDFRGAVVEASIARPRAAGGGDSESYSATLGYGDPSKDRFNVFVTLQAQGDDHLKAIDRAFGSTVARPDLFIPAQYRFSSNSFPAAVNIPGVGLRSPAGPIYSSATGLTCLPPASYGATPTDNRCRYDYVTQIDILPDVDRRSAFLRATAQVLPAATLFTEVLYSKNESTYRSSQTPASEATTFAGAPILLPVTSPYYPRAWLQQFFPAAVGQPMNLYYRSIEAGPRTNYVEEESTRFVIGLEGTLGAWDYTAAYSNSVNKPTEYFRGGWLQESALISAFATGRINPFATNDAAGLEALFATQFIGKVRISRSERETIDARFTREFGKLPGGPLALAVGGEYSRLEYDDQPQPVLSSGDVIGSGGNQVAASGSRKVNAFFAELSAPVLKDLELQLAVRHDDYSDFGRTTNPKAAFRWQPAPAVLLRGSTGSGFLAPTSPQLLRPAQQSVTGGTYNDPYYDSSLPGNPAASRCAVQFDGRYCVAQLTALQGGNPNLNPEKSRQYTLGIVLEPVRDVSLALDYWAIRQRDVIGIISPDTKIADFINNFDRATRTSSSIYAGSIATQTDSSINSTVISAVNSVFENIARQDTRGFDVSLKARLPQTALGRFGLSFEGTYIDSQKQSLPGSDPTEVVGTWSLFGPVVRFKHTTALAWERGGWSATLAYNWVGGTKDQNTTGAVVDPDRRIAPWESWDLLATWRATKSLTASLGLRNVLDRDPPSSNQLQYFQVGYDPTYADPRGRTILARLSYSYQ